MKLTIVVLLVCFSLSQAFSPWGIFKKWKEGVEESLDSHKHNETAERFVKEVQDRRLERLDKHIELGKDVWEKHHGNKAHKVWKHAMTEEPEVIPTEPFEPTEPIVTKEPEMIPTEAEIIPEEQTESPEEPEPATESSEEPEPTESPEEPEPTESPEEPEATEGPQEPEPTEGPEEPEPTEGPEEPETTEGPEEPEPTEGPEEPEPTEIIPTETSVEDNEEPIPEAPEYPDPEAEYNSEELEVGTEQPTELELIEEPIEGNNSEEEEEEESLDLIDEDDDDDNQSNEEEVAPVKIEPIEDELHLEVDNDFAPKEPLVGVDEVPAAYKWLKKRQLKLKKLWRKFGVKHSERLLKKIRKLEMKIAVKREE